MTINDLRVGMKCTILSSRKDKQHTGDVIIRKIKGFDVYVDVIKVDNKIVSLSGVSNFLIVNVPNMDPEIFSYITPVIIQDKADGKSYYKFQLKTSSKKYNRRKNARLYIGTEVNVRADQNTKTYPCILRDISATGFALVFSPKYIPSNYSKIKSFHLVYNDYDLEHTLKVSLSLTGYVKRCISLDGGRLLFGCWFPKSSKVEKYITDKEKITKKR